MYAPRKTYLFLIALFTAQFGFAVTASIGVDQQPLCTYPTGTISVYASGGVGPYTILWSTGETSNSINGLSAGYYSVTVTDANSDQATADIDLQAGDYSEADYSGWAVRPYCSGVFPDANFIVITPGLSVVPWGTPPYYLDGEPMTQVDQYPGYDSYMGVVSGPAGVPYYATFSDATGCSGQWSVTPVGPIDWAELTIMDIQGSCETFPTGKATIANTASNSNLVGYSLNNLTTQTLITAEGWFDAGSPSTFQITDLPAGDYQLRQYIAGLSDSEECFDDLFFTIPDLGPSCGKVRGRAYMDYNQSCTKQSNEPAAPGQVIEVLPGPYYATTNGAGMYEMVLPFGDYSLTQQGSALVEHCTGGPIPFTISGSPNTIIRDLPDTSLVGLDVQLAMSSGNARPGFEFKYGINVRNFTPGASGATSVAFEFDPTLTYISASPTPTNVSGNTITWDQSQLTAWQQRSYTVRFQVPPDIGLLGYQLVATANVTTTNTDGNLANNSATNLRTITGGYDPNDKLAVTSSGNSDAWYLDQDEWVDYTIRFQNTGTDTAFHVVITDTLPSNLDPGSVVIGASSHTFTWEMHDQGTLKFHFPNILLPDSNVNEAASHGFASFRIKPREPLLLGTTIENTANIFFDHNPPVITDSSVLTVTSPGVVVRPKVFLGGPCDETTQRMGDGLRTAGLIPLAEPYTAMGYVHVGGGSESTTTGVLAVSGDDAIVDWVVVELRSPNAPYGVVATRSALLQRDGDVVGANGTSAVQFFAASGPYKVAVRHRNHLGCMTANAFTLGPTPEAVDLSISNTPAYGTNARNPVGTRMVLWQGDCTSDGRVKYTGAGNDRDRILSTIDNIDPTTVIQGYHTEDVNMDGVVKYTGVHNDRDRVL